MIIRSDHPSLMLECEVRQICKSLFDNSPITYFEYARYYFDGTFFQINTHSQVAHLYLSQQLYPHLAEFAANQHRYILMTKKIALQPAAELDARKYLSNIDLFSANDIEDRFYIDDQGENYFDCCGFGTPKNQKIDITFFFSNLDILENFRSYFIQMAAPLIKKIERHKIQLFNEEDLARADWSKKNLTQQVIAIPKDTLRREMLNNLYATNITPREYECIKQLAHGQSMKIIASNLKVSYKSIEAFVQGARQKLKCATKQHLIKACESILF